MKYYYLSKFLNDFAYNDCDLYEGLCYEKKVYVKHEWFLFW